MNIILIQPPDPAPPLEPVDSAYGDSIRFVPPWELLCLRSFLVDRSRHTCTFFDCRLCDDLEKQLPAAIGALPEPRIAVVNTSTLGLGEAVAVIEITRRQFPDIRIVASGTHASQFPLEMASTPNVDFVLAGDPEPILRNLLDYVDVSHRLRRIPGLVQRGETTVEPYWLPDLKSLTLPDWQGVHWPAYSIADYRPGSRVEIRLSRGHTHLEMDRAYGSSAEPLRVWPFDRMAAAIQKCAHQGIVEVFIADPPGFWTTERLGQWCSALRHTRNTQPWAFQLMPCVLSQEEVEALRFSGCQRMEFLFPSCDPRILTRYECALDLHAMSHTVQMLQKTGITVQASFWVGGPEEEGSEKQRVVSVLKHLGFCPYSLHAFPFILDAPLHDEVAGEDHPTLEAWIAWSRDPWLEERPHMFWGGKDGKDRTALTMKEIEKAVFANPRRRFKRLLANIRSRNWLTELEDKAANLLHRATQPKS